MKSEPSVVAFYADSYVKVFSKMHIEISIIHTMYKNKCHLLIGETGIFSKQNRLRLQE